MLVRLLVCLAMGVSIVAAGCGGGSSRELAAFPLDSLGEIVDADDRLFLDLEETADGRGAIRVAADRPRVVRLVAVENPAVDNCLLVWKAQLRSEALRGRAFLETWVRLPGADEYFGRGFESGVRRTTDWTESQTVFRLEKGQKPDRVRLNLVIEGEGKVWIDDLKLVVAPLPR